MSDSSSATKHTFSTAHDWRDAAMQCESLCDVPESERRQLLADAHNKKENMFDPDLLADQQLYIQGKMDVEEYQNYLLFKHSN